MAFAANDGEKRAIAVAQHAHLKLPIYRMTDLILIADDHPLFREGLRRLIASNLPDAVIAEAGSMDEVDRFVEANGAPDIFVLDLLFPGMNPRETLPSLRQSHKKSSIIVVSMLDDERVIRSVMASGADGYIVKSIAAEEIIDGILSIRSGNYVIAKPKPGEGPANSAVTADLTSLTDRQHEVLMLISQGYSNKEIGRKLDLSHLTVRNYVSLLLRIFNLQSRVELADVAAAAAMKNDRC